MADIVDKVKNFVVYFDHDNTVVGVNWDDIVANEMAEHPTVPKKVGEKIPVFYTNLQNMTVHQFKCTEGESSGPPASEKCDGFLDSDYEMEDGDEDILETFADENEGHVGEISAKDNKQRAAG